MLPLRDGSVLLGNYGGGLTRQSGAGLIPQKNADAQTSNLEAVPPFPAPAAPPTQAHLTAMLTRVKSLTGTLPVGGGAYLGEDWRTQGDWIGHYGRQYAVLCAAGAPLDHNMISDPTYSVQGQIGDVHMPGDSLRRWVHWAHTDYPRSLYDPIPGYRRQAEWDDHSETYPYPYDGPDVWLTVTVPNGVHLLSFYDINKDGHNGGPFTYRDYPVELLPYLENIEDAKRLTPLAQTRVVNFWNGMYKSFVVRGPAKYYLRLGRNHSFCTLLAGVFLDRLTGPITRRDCVAWMGGVRYPIPDPDAPTAPDPHLLEKLLASGGQVARKIPGTVAALNKERLTAASRSLWAALDKAQDEKSALVYQYPFRLLAYRAVLNANDSEVLQAAWRWKLRLWNPEDRDVFNQTMAKAHDTLLELYPEMKDGQY